MAAQIRSEFGFGSGPADVDLCCSVAGSEVTPAPLDSSQGGVEAMLVPLRGGRFRIVVDDDLARGHDAATARHRHRFRVAHELAHTFFYLGGSGGPPRRLAPHGGDAEEAFCDEFARHMLVSPPERPLGAREIVALHNSLDVSMEVAARAAAAGADQAAIGLWWWRATTALSEANVMLQWTSDERLPGVLGVVPYRTSPTLLTERMVEHQRRSPGTSFVVLPERRQVISVLN